MLRSVLFGFICCADYFFKLSDDLVIDAGPMGNNARFLNHACSPNCKTELWQIGAQQRVGIFTLKDVPKGEELTYDYNFEGFWQPGAALVRETHTHDTHLRSSQRMTPVRFTVCPFNFFP